MLRVHSGSIMKETHLASGKFPKAKVHQEARGFSPCNKGKGKQEENLLFNVAKGTKEVRNGGEAAYLSWKYVPKDFP